MLILKIKKPVLDLVFIEGGTFTKGQVQDDVMHDWNNTPSRQHVMSFYIDETEVTNLMYLEFLDWLETGLPTKSTFSTDKFMKEPYQIHWFGEITLGLYGRTNHQLFRHPAYAEYPVVGINWLQAVQFAEWRTIG